ncbi:MAG: recombinase family protein, partial [Labilithrix sp.]|nr:recombinase family protein [Labilithrix sp.]
MLGAPDDGHAHERKGGQDMKQGMAGRLAHKRIAVYARYSSENQRESSIEDQLHRARDFVDREGGNKAGVIVVSDRAASGSRFGREGLAQLRELAQEGRVDAVVVEDVSRLTRDQEHAAALLKLFARTGVTLYGIADGIDTSQSKARLNVGLRALMAEDYLADLADKTLRGQEGRARAGLSTGGRL